MMNNREDEATNGWILGICSIIFDIDEGQKLEECFPHNALSDDEANDVAFHSFPVYLCSRSLTRFCAPSSLWVFALKAGVPCPVL